ncbi:Protein of unknown function [Thermobacillus xylanilyticus]|uniref:Uncharacterized protein n=1 Tax=Thermobacillus xylanilyticus TaxID=76633 RepID=A0ABM8V999_THEXY|nr:Protein of unknown function [Thermobacillus xylanilyticus]
MLAIMSLLIKSYHVQYSTTLKVILFLVVLTND